MNIQLIIVVLIIVAAVFYVGRSVYRSSRGHACESGNCNCQPKTNQKV